MFAVLCPPIVCPPSLQNPSAVRRERDNLCGYPVRGPTATMLSPDELAYQKVARLATRYFYDDVDVLIVEVLLNAPRKDGWDHEPEGTTHPVMQLDGDIATRLKLHAKQVRRHLDLLHEDRLVIKRRGEAKAKDDTVGEAREVKGFAADALASGDVRMLWGVDYETLTDVVHFKLDAMRRVLDDDAKRATAQQVCHRRPESALGGCQAARHLLSTAA